MTVLETRRSRATTDAARIAASIERLAEVSIATMSSAAANAVAAPKDTAFLDMLDAGEDLADGRFLADLR